MKTQLASRSPTGEEAIFILYVRPGRRKAKKVAAAEVIALLRDLGATSSKGGPLSEVRGVAWVGLPIENVTTACSRIARLGYSSAVDLVQPLASNLVTGTETVVTWKRHEVALVRIYEESDEQLRDLAPDRRTFLLQCGDGVVRAITGYRGSPGPFEHRALPVFDARLLVNLVWKESIGVLLDLFAGAGGIVIEAKAAGWTTVSVDNDPSLRFGLAQLSDYHIVASAISLPIADASVDAVASEPPYHPAALDVVIASLTEISRVLKPGGRVALLVAGGHAQPIAHAAEKLKLLIEINEPIDRKGTSVTCLCWRTAR